MSAAQFTPGPWFASPYSSIVGIGVLGVGGRVIASVAVAPGFNPTAKHDKQEHVEYAAEIGANARLIAAAPDLYEALTVCCRRLRVCAATGGNSPDMIETLMEQFEAPLAKVRGGQ